MDRQFSPLLEYRGWNGDRWRLRRIGDELLEHAPAYAGWSRRDGRILYMDRGRRRIAALCGSHFEIRDPLGALPPEWRTSLSFTDWQNRQRHAAWDAAAQAFRMWES